MKEKVRVPPTKSVLLKNVFQREQKLSQDPVGIAPFPAFVISWEHLIIFWAAHELINMNDKLHACCSPVMYQVFLN